LIPYSVPFEGIFEETSLESNEKSVTDNFKTTNPILEEAIKDKTKFGQLYEVYSPRY